MAGQYYATDPARVGIIKGEILKQAMFDEVLGAVGKPLQMDKNRGRTYKVKRYLPYGGVDNQWVAAGGDDEFVAAHMTGEGVTPSADSLTSTVLSLVPTQFSCLYTYTDQTAIYHEDDIPAEETRQAGKRIALVRELYAYGKLKASTSSHYGGAGTSTGTVNGKITPTLLRRVQRSLQRHYCDPVKEIISPSPNFATYPVDAAWFVYTHTDVTSDLYDLPFFTKVAEYGDRTKALPREIGSWESFRFITAPHLTYYPGGGAAVGATGLKADNSTNIDVYPMIVVGADCFAHLALRGQQAINANHIPYNQPSKSDPGGQRGYVWASTEYGAEITNPGWMAVVEVGVTAL